MRRSSPIDREVLWEKCGYKPHSQEQQGFHDSRTIYRIPICGRRFGKSTMSAMDMTEACFIPDSHYWICGPTYKLAEKEFRIVYQNFCSPKKLDIGSKIKKSYNAKQGDMRMEFPWNTVLECTSATNPDSLLGEGLDGVIMSESAEHTLQTWEQYIEPALSDKEGWADFPTTPKGFNWVHGLWQLGQHPEEPMYESWQYPTWLNLYRYPGGFDPNCSLPNPHNTRHIPGICTCNERLVSIWRRVSENYWRQQYGAEFTTFQGQIYDEFDPKIHVTDIHYNPAWRNYWVFDYGFAVPFVCLDIMVDPSDNVYVWREYQVRHKTTWEHAHILKERENPPGFHFEGLFGDPRGADEAATIALVLGYVSGRPVPWSTGIEWVKRWLKPQADGKPKLFFDRSCTETIRQMQALRRAEAKEGKDPKEGQVDYDDHGPDALRYFFSEYFVLGAGSSLADIYTPSELGSESETFFTSKRSITLGTNFG